MVAFLGEKLEQDRKFRLEDLQEKNSSRKTKSGSLLYCKSKGGIKEPVSSMIYNII